jgi:hypothetical protein
MLISNIHGKNYPLSMQVRPWPNNFLSLEVLGLIYQIPMNSKEKIVTVKSFIKASI